MLDIDLRTRRPPVDLTAQARLTDLAVGVRLRWPDLHSPLMIEWSEYLRLGLQGDTPWIFGPAERDPQRGRRGSVLPRSARAQLTKVAASGVPFQRVVIAHELDPDGPVEDLLPALASGVPKPVADDLAKFLVGPVPVHPGVSRAVQFLDRAVHGVITTGQAPASLLGAMLDLIVIGVIAPTPLRENDLSLWYPLAAWRW